MFFYINDIAILYYQLNYEKYKEFKTALIKAFVIKDIGDLK